MELHRVKKQLTTVYRYAYTKLALNYYSYFEIFGERPYESERIEECTREFNRLLALFLSGTDSLEEISRLRKQVSASMEALTGYADCFQNYEYAINRMERKFNEKLPDVMSEEEIVDAVCQYIRDSKDAVVVNGRIQEVVGQLPIRLTRSKFYHMVNDALSIYIGGEKAALESMMYLLRTASMVRLPADMLEGFEELAGLLSEMKTVDMTKLDNDGFRHISGLLAKAAQVTNDESGDYMMLMDLVNGLYLMMLSRKDAVIDLGEENLLSQIVTGVLERFQAEDFTEPDEELDEKLVLLEGKQEGLYDKYLTYDLSGQQGPYEDTMKTVGKLMSDSPFADLDEEENHETADREYVENTVNVFFEELDQMFQTVKKPIVRAVMGRVLSLIPVFFQSMYEVEDYIRGSLQSCTDIAEKEACIELLTGIIND